MGNVSIAISVAPAIGPTVSGLILQFLLLALHVLDRAADRAGRPCPRGPAIGNVGEPGRQRLDIVVGVVVGAAFGGIVYGLSRLGGARVRPQHCTGPPRRRHPLPARFRLAAAAAGARRGPAAGPAGLQLTMFTPVRCSAVAMVALFGAIILLPIYLQNVRGLTTLQTGLLLLPGGLLMGLLGPASAGSSTCIGPPVLATSGGVVWCSRLLGLSTVDAEHALWLLADLPPVARRTGLAFLFTPRSPRAEPVAADACIRTAARSCPRSSRCRAPPVPPRWWRSWRFAPHPSPRPALPLCRRRSPACTSPSWSRPWWPSGRWPARCSSPTASRLR